MVAIPRLGAGFVFARVGGEGEGTEPATVASAGGAEGEGDFGDLLALLAEDFAGVANRRRRV
jgi:hypothetical protein